jgi:hypothetical protein
MKNPSFIYGSGIVALVAMLLMAGCTSVFPGSATPTPTPLPTPVPTVVPADTPVSYCGFTTCHGSELACGMDAPQVCTEEYRIGDRCRQYARCDTGIGSCTLVASPRFTQCKACAERCQIQAGPDNLAAMTCEEKC